MLKKNILAVSLVFITGIFNVGCSSYSGSNSNDASNKSQTEQVTDAKAATSKPPKDTSNLDAKYLRTDNGEGGVQVAAVWVTPESLETSGEEDLANKYDLNSNIVFKIEMTTHMGDLTTYQILNKARLAVGGKTIKPARWDILSNTPHHPEGFLVFPAQTKGQISTLELNLKELNGIPNRKLIW